MSIVGVIDRRERRPPSWLHGLRGRSARRFRAVKTSRRSWLPGCELRAFVTHNPAGHSFLSLRHGTVVGLLAGGPDDDTPPIGIPMFPMTIRMSPIGIPRPLFSVLVEPRGYPDQRSIPIDCDLIGGKGFRVVHEALFRGTLS